MSTVLSSQGSIKGVYRYEILGRLHRKPFKSRQKQSIRRLCLFPKQNSCVQLCVILCFAHWRNCMQTLRLAFFVSNGCIERPVNFISPAEAVHGGTEFLQTRDVMVSASRSGKTKELLPIMNICQKNITIITITERTHILHLLMRRIQIAKFYKIKYGI